MKFYIILATAMWAGIVGWMVMAYWGAIQEVEARHKGPGPLCGAVPTGPFYQALIPKLIMAFMFLVTLTLFFFPALLRPYTNTSLLYTPLLRIYAHELQLHCIIPLYLGTSPINLCSSLASHPHSPLKGSRFNFIICGSMSRSPFFSIRSISSSRIHERGTNCKSR